MQLSYVSSLRSFTLCYGLRCYLLVHGLQNSHDLSMHYLIPCTQLVKLLPAGSLAKLLTNLIDALGFRLCVLVELVQRGRL